MMYLKNVGKRALALVLALMMCVGMLSTAAFAEDAPETTEPEVVETEDKTEATETETGDEAGEPEEVELVETVQTPLAAAPLAAESCEHNYQFDHHVLMSNCALAHDDVYKCTKCGDTMTKHVQTHSHQMQYTNNALGYYHTAKCSVCGYSEPLRDHKVKNPATCQTGATCICGKVMGDKNPNNHVNTETVTVPATCTTDGFTTITCKDCGEIVSTTPLERTGHSFTGNYVQAGTSGHARQCANCTATSEPEAHRMSDWKVEIEAECLTEGKETRSCTVCGLRQSQTIDALGHNYVNGTCTRCGDSDPSIKTDCEHKNMVKDEEKSHAATCTLPEVIVWNCADCDFVRSEVKSLALGHDYSVSWGTHADNKSATCTEKGAAVYRCSRYDECKAFEVREVPMKPHTASVIAEVPATCTKTGTAAHWTCTVCSKLFKGTKEVTADDLVIAINPKNHTGKTDKWQEVNDAIHGMFCTDCKQQYATGNHTFGAWSYNESEQNWSRVCGDCGYTQTTTDADAIHDCDDYWSEDYYPSNNGHAHMCTFPGCGNMDVTVNHDFGEWAVIRPAQVGVAGERVHTCESCGYMDSEAIPALPGTGGDTEIDDPDIPLGGGAEDGGDEVELDDAAVPLAGPVTRAEFVDFLYRDAGSPEAGMPTFTDVPADHEFAPAVGWGQANDIAWGVSETEFLPDELVTVEQVKLFLARYAKFKGIEMPELAALVGLDDQDPAMNCDEILGEFFGTDDE